MEYLVTLETVGPPKTWGWRTILFFTPAIAQNSIMGAIQIAKIKNKSFKNKAQGNIFCLKNKKTTLSKSILLLQRFKNPEIAWSFLSKNLLFYASDRKKTKSTELFWLNCGDNLNYQTKSKTKGLLDIALHNTQIFGVQSVKYIQYIYAVVKKQFFFD